MWYILYIHVKTSGWTAPQKYKACKGEASGLSNSITCAPSVCECHMSHVTCRMSHVTCHMSHVVLCHGNPPGCFRFAICLGHMATNSQLIPAPSSWRDSAIRGVQWRRHTWRWYVQEPVAVQPHVSLRQLRPQLRQLIVKLQVLLSQIRKYWRFSSAEELGMSVVVPPILLGLDERHWNKKLQEPNANLGQKWLEEHVQWHDMNTFMMTTFHDMIYNYYYVVGPLLSGTLSKRFPSSCVLVMSMIHVQMVHSCLWFMSMIHVQMVHSCLWFMSMIHVCDSCFFSRNPPPWSAKTPWFLWSA